MSKVNVWLCRTESGCRYGASCRFVHSAGDAAPADDTVGNSAKVGTDAAGSAQMTGDVDDVETAMVGLNVGGPSLPDNTLTAGATACPSSSTMDAVSGAAAAAKSRGKKMKSSAKKGAKKAKQLSECKELVLYDHQTVKCGQ